MYAPDRGTYFYVMKHHDDIICDWEYFFSTSNACHSCTKKQCTPYFSWKSANWTKGNKTIENSQTWNSSLASMEIKNIKNANILRVFAHHLSCFFLFYNL